MTKNCKYVIEYQCIWNPDDCDSCAFYRHSGFSDEKEDQNKIIWSKDKI